MRREIKFEAQKLVGLPENQEVASTMTWRARRSSKMLKYIFSYFALSCCLWVLVSADTLTLEEVIVLAQERSLPAYRAKADQVQAQMAYRTFRAGLLPQLSLEGTVPNYTNSFLETVQPDGSLAFQRISYNNSSLSLQMTQSIPLTGATVFARSNLQRYDDFIQDAKSYNGTPLRVGIYQPISAYNQSRWEQKIAPVQLSESRKQFIYDMEAIGIQTIPFFFDLLLAQLDQQIAEANLSGNQSLYEIAGERFALGKISENDLLQLKLELINAEKASYEAALSVAAAQVRLNNFLGRFGDPDPTYLRTPSGVEMSQISMEKALSEARLNRPEWESFQRRTLQAAEQVAQTRSENGFQAALQASFGLARSNPELSPIYSDPQQEQAVWLTLSVPILDWGQRSSQVKIARLEQAYTQEAVQQEAETHLANVGQLVSYYQQLQQTIRLGKEAQEIALRRFEISKNRYLVGDISITDLTIALLAKDQARRSYAFALRDYWQTHYRLRLLTLYDFKNQQRITYVSFDD
ncbi:MAG: TolC family protein [Bacteroidota bacterium]